VNNAGINILEPFLDMKIESFKEVMKINLESSLILS